MATLLIKLNNAPEDEVVEIRKLLDEHDIRYYETEAGRWGISLAGIWLPDESQLEQANDLLHRYQSERSIRVQQEYEEERRSGNAETFWHRLMHSPLMVIVYLIVIVLILYLSLLPFMQFL